jgi:hypothetical protein
MSGEWLWPLHLSISRTDPFTDPFTFTGGTDDFLDPLVEGIGHGTRCLASGLTKPVGRLTGNQSVLEPDG